MATILNDREVSLRSTVPRILFTTTIIDSIGDLTVSPGTFFNKNAAGVVSPAYMVLDITTTHFTNPTYSWSYSSSKDNIYIPLNFTGKTLTLTIADFLTHAGNGKIVTYMVTSSQFPYQDSRDIIEITYDTIDWDLQQNKLSITDIDNSSIPYTDIKRPVGGGDTLHWLETTYNNNQIYIPYVIEG